MNSQPWHICVVIPARNEDANLAPCLESISIAREMLPPGISCDVVVAVDSSSACCWRVAAELQRMKGAVVLTAKGSTGEARRVAAAAALTRYTGRLNRCWLANVEPDRTVPVCWLLDQIGLANRGVEVVEGVVGAASFGVRADIYARAGGWQDSKSGPERDLRRRLSSMGAVWVSNPDRSSLPPALPLGNYQLPVRSARSVARLRAIL